MAQNWLQHTLERTGLQTRSQATALIALGVIITLIFGGIYLSQVATYAATNREIEDRIAERNELELRNEDLRAEIARLETVPRLLERAEALGFRPASAEEIQYLVIAGYNPDRDGSVVPLVGENDEFQDIASYDATFGGWLQQQWDSLQQQFNTFGR